MIFTSQLAPEAPGYGDMADRMVRAVSSQPGFLGFDSVRDASRAGITVSYWDSLDSIRRWKAVAEHREAQKMGQEKWYSKYRVRIAEVKEEYGS